MLAENIRGTRGKTLDPSKVFGGLTFKQLAYCNNRAAGMSALDSYRAAYSPNANDDSSSVRAWELERDSRIVEKIEALLAERTPQTSLVPVVTKTFVLDGIVSIATKETAKDNVRLRAFELLGKHVGLFKDEQPDDSDKPKSIADIDAKLAEYFKRMTTIEGDATRVDSDKGKDLTPVDPAARRGDRRRKPIG